MDAKKQTAVEWLVEQLECFGNKHELQLSWATVDELVDQAKAMEKQQTIDFTNDYLNDDEYLTPEHYYNETYGN